MKRGIFLTLATFSGFAALPRPLAAQTEADATRGKVTWPREYILDIPKPHSEIAEGKPYLANVVQNLISDELFLQRHAVTRGKVAPLTIEYSVQKNHEALPADERKALLGSFPKPAVLPLKIVRRPEDTASHSDCKGRREDRYTLLTRISGTAAKIKLDVLLCQGGEIMHEQSTVADEQELVAGITRLINPVRARLTGDAYASLNIESTPTRASIYLDDQFLGKTPLKYSYLIPGKYRLIVKKDGFDMASEAISVGAGETLARKLPLAAAQGGGVIDIHTNPLGARIYLDADYKGLTPKKLENIGFGTYRVHLLHPEKGEVYKSVTLNEKNPQVQMNETLTEFAFQYQPGFLGFSYKTWYVVSITASALCFGSGIGFYVWRDQAQEEIFGRLSGKPTSLYTQEDTDFVADRTSAYNTRNTVATSFMVGAGFFAVLSIYFYVQHLLSADEGIVMKRPSPSNLLDENIKIQIGGVPGTTGITASYRF